MEEEVAVKKGRTRKACGGSQGGEQEEQKREERVEKGVRGLIKGRTLTTSRLLRMGDGHCNHISLTYNTSHITLGKMKPNDSEYACRVTLSVKKDGSRRFCGDYRPVNRQTHRDSFPMPLVDDVISQLGKSTWFTALDLQSGFWQIRMALEDVKKTALVTKTRLYDWTVMPFGLKNVTNTFTRTMSTVFKELGDKFLKIFVDDLNVHSEN